MKIRQNKKGEFTISQINKNDLRGILSVLSIIDKGIIEMSKINRSEAIQLMANALESIGHDFLINATEEQKSKYFDNELEIALSVSMFVDLLKESGLTVKTYQI
jgi:hypothetical protein